MTQKEAILNHLRSHTHITPLEALGLYRVFRLSARIMELRAQGHDIITQTKQDPTGKTYARYVLRADAQEAA